MAAANTYTAVFDTSRLPRTRCSRHLVPRLGHSRNESSPGYLLSLDNTPAIADSTAPYISAEEG